MKVSYTGHAAKQLARLPADIREDLIAKIHRYANTGAGRVKRLQGLAGARIRAGDYRVIFEETQDELTVVAAGHRRDVYR